MAEWVTLAKVRGRDIRTRPHGTGNQIPIAAANNHSALSTVLVSIRRNNVCNLIKRTNTRVPVIFLKGCARRVQKFPDSSHFAFVLQACRDNRQSVSKQLQYETVIRNQITIKWLEFREIPCTRDYQKAQRIQIVAYSSDLWQHASVSFSSRWKKGIGAHEISRIAPNRDRLRWRAFRPHDRDVSPIGEVTEALNLLRIEGLIFRRGIENLTRAGNVDVRNDARPTVSSLTIGSRHSTSSHHAPIGSGLPAQNLRKKSSFSPSV